VKIIDQSFEILTELNGIQICKNIEVAARTSYKSEGSITGNSYEKLVKKLIDSHHDSTLEFGGPITIRIVTNRAIANEIVRHRVGFSYNQESSRYVNYTKDKFDNQITFIKPHTLVEGTFPYKIWKYKMEDCERAYLDLVEFQRVTPQIARGVLPLDTKTEIVVSGNPRSWRNMFSMRCEKDAHPQIRQLMLQILEDLHNQIPILFDDLYERFKQQ
jgi:thymidylate synthase (FAD)